MDMQKAALRSWSISNVLLLLKVLCLILFIPERLLMVLIVNYAKAEPSKSPIIFYLSIREGSSDSSPYQDLLGLNSSRNRVPVNIARTLAVRSHISVTRSVVKMP